MGAENTPPIEMADIRPFMMNAYIDWISASKCTPYVQVRADGATVPREHVKNGKIILNVSVTAVRNFLLNENGMMFNCRFSGKDFPVHVPINNIELIYARENGEGCHFVSDEESDIIEGVMEGTIEVPKAPEKKGKPTLTVVK